MGETAVNNLAIAGATLAQIMHDFGSVDGDCDGILFGRLQHRTTSSIHDDYDEAGPAITQEQVTARVTGYYCSGRVQSFYDAMGRLDHSKLSSIVKERQDRGEDPAIGWYIGRRDSALWPSMREAGVTSNFRSGILTTTAGVEDDEATTAAANQIARPELNASKVGANAEVGEHLASSTSMARRKPSLAISDSGNQIGTPGAPSVRSSSASSSGQERRVQPSASVGSRKKGPALPCVFVLFTESQSSQNAVKTHEYRAFQSIKNPTGLTIEPLPVSIVNAGVSIRGVYESFAPVASVPSWFNMEFNSEANTGGSSAMARVGGERSSFGKSAASPDNGGGRSSRSSQAYRDSPDVTPTSLVENAKGGLRISQFETMYQQMLTKLEKLSREAYDSSAMLRQSSRSST